MFRVIFLAGLLVILSACTHMEEKTCICPIPPEIQLVPQEELTLPAPDVKIVRPENGKPYFVMSQDAFYVWLDDNKQLEQYITNCKLREELTKRYYEESLKPLREQDKDGYTNNP